MYRRALHLGATRLLPVLLALLLAGTSIGVAAAETHVVKSGDTLYGIGMKYGVEPDEIATANGLSDPSRLRVGQQLEIPTGTGAGAPQASGEQTYTVASGDTLGAIADRFGISEQSLAAANGITNPNRIQVGQTLAIPGQGSNSATSAPSGATYTVVIGDTLSSIAEQFGLTSTAIAEANELDNPNSLRAGQKIAIPGRAEPASRGGRRAAMVWPAIGPITGYYHERGPYWVKGYHEGLDIGASFGSPIRAAEDGIVVEAESGWNSGYGTYVKVDHGDGLVTLYAHMSKLASKPWQEVKRGELIGYIGSTGASTGPHLHFEVRIGGEKLDPLAYLP
ncbi:MAG: LysM peptidoglycan-binding domain-containing M23 family metallopeptidase [Chloroflexota bacterium]